MFKYIALTAAPVYEFYKEYEEAALAPTATDEDVSRLWDWFEAHGNRFWNGERYEIDTTHTLWPVYGEEDEHGSIPVIGLEIH